MLQHGDATMIFGKSVERKAPQGGWPSFLPRRRLDRRPVACHVSVPSHKLGAPPSAELYFIEVLPPRILIVKSFSSTLICPIGAHLTIKRRHSPPQPC